MSHVSQETRVRVRVRGDAWEVRGITLPLPVGVAWTWGPLPAHAPWPALLEHWRALDGFEVRARTWAGMLVILKRGAA